MRLPYTHQSALTYPLPPPSTILGMLAGALQRVEGRPPLECLEEVEAAVAACAALVDDNAPIVARSCVVSLITKIQGRGAGKVTDALPRQFAHTHRITALAFSEDAGLIARLGHALQRAPVTLGGSESLAAVCEVGTGEAIVENLNEGEPVRTRAYVARDLMRVESLQERHGMFWVHERCLDAKELEAYLFPVTMDGHIYRPSPIAGVLDRPASCYRIPSDDIVLTIVND